jgi:hypothetical protein
LGYFEAAITDVGPTRLNFNVVRMGTGSFELFTTSDNTKESGAPLYAYWPREAGSKYTVTVIDRDPDVEPATYTIRAAFHQVNDPNEPNDSPEQATALKLGTPVSGAIFPSRGDKDYFALDLQAGPLRVQIAGVPKDVLATVYLQGPQSESQQTEGKGAPLDWTVPIKTAGRYTLRVSDTLVTELPYKTSSTPLAVPNSFAATYTLTVTQQ